MNNPAYGRTTRLVATGLSTITSANAHIIGVMMAATGTCQLIIYHGVTASASAAYVRGYVTVPVGGQPGQYFPCPAYCSGGITVDVNAALDPDITRFWNPST